MGSSRSLLGNRGASLRLLGAPRGAECAAVPREGGGKLTDELFFFDRPLNAREGWFLRRMRQAGRAATERALRALIQRAWARVNRLTPVEGDALADAALARCLLRVRRSAAARLFCPRVWAMATEPRRRGDDSVSSALLRLQRLRSGLSRLL